MREGQSTGGKTHKSLPLSRDFSLQKVSITQLGKLLQSVSAFFSRLPSIIGLCLVFLVFFPLLSPSTSRAFAVETKHELKGSLTLKAQAVQPTDLPVLFTVRLTNTGDAPFSFWSGRGSQGYPQGEQFQIQILDAARKTVAAEPFNGAYTQGSGTNREIAPAATLEFPLAVSALAAGTYEVKLSSAKSGYLSEGKNITTWPAMETKEAIKVTVKPDEKQKSQIESDLLRRVQGGEFFAARLVNHFPIPAVTNKLPALLNNDSVKDAFNVAYALSMSKEIPVGCGKHINSAMSKYLARTNSSYETTNLMVYLAEIAKRAGDDQSLEAVAKLAKDGPSLESRWRAVQAIAQFKQPSVVAMLKQYLKSEETAVKGAAAVGLAEHNDPAAIPVLIEVTQTRDGHQSWNSIYRALAKFPKDSRAKKAINDGLKSSDESLRREAEAVAKTSTQ